MHILAAFILPTELDFYMKEGQPHIDIYSIKKHNFLHTHT